MSSKRQNRTPVSALRNLGPKSIGVCAEAGIESLEELRELGAAKAYARIKFLRPDRASLNFLWALAAGLQDRDWRDLTPQEKESLIAEVRGLRR